MLRQFRVSAERMAGHPDELFWRDIGVLEHRIAGSEGAAGDAFKRVLRIVGTLPDSPIKSWNRLIIEVHAKTLCGQATPERRLPAAVLSLHRQACHVADGSELLLAYRRFSPY
jgi:hypothetical protein